MGRVNWGGKWECRIEKEVVGEVTDAKDILKMSYRIVIL